MKRKLTVILLLIALVVTAGAISMVATASAAENGVVYVHFYNGSGEYSWGEWAGKKDVNWGSYYWIDTGRVTAWQGNDEEFAKRDDDGNVTLGQNGEPNIGKLFKINLNASETKACQQGKKLGLIMVRSYVDELGYLTPYWNNNTGKDLSSDRYLDVQFDSNNEYHIWIIAGDKNNYTSLASAKSAFERIESANFDDFNSLILQSTKAITPQTDISIYKVTDAIENPEGELFLQNLHVSEVWNGGLNGKITNLGLESGFDWSADYQVYIEEVSAFRTSANKTRLFLSDKFKTDCVPSADQKLGVEYTKDNTTFRVWAPLSTNVVVNFYRTGNELDLSLARSALAMTRGEKGVWELAVNEDLNGIYYTYTNYVAGDAPETVDVYASAVGVNGNRGMICDLDATDPDGWDEDLTNARSIRQNNSQNGVIWEVHVRDFSISPDSGLTYKGKYLAFTEQNTTVKGSTLKSGIAYLKELGINYVHLNPVYDFSTVDEEYINNTDYTTKQNWGYDPKNYNVPEGSYATDAEHGEVRINEFKQMVQALHEAGIGVIMDVVYNHTYTADSYFEKTVPGYYYRQALEWGHEGDNWFQVEGTFGKTAWTTNALGAYNLSDGSGCSNETASEREMYRKYMVDSLTFWADEYHIDGFRFDLMAIHDTKTMQSIRNSLNELPGGQCIFLYGEPWAAGSLGMEKGYVSADTNSLGSVEMTGIRAFNDRMREGIKGNNSGGTGYVQGNTSDDSLNRVKAGINGYFAGTDSAGNNHAITYTTSHDNYTLWDQLITTIVTNKTPTLYSERNAVIERKNIMAATLTLTSRGTAFILAGEEFARTKYGNHNSYNAQDKINALDYARQKEFAALTDWYRGLIHLRTDFKGIATGTSPAEIIPYDGDKANCIGYIFNSVEGDPYSRVYVLTNPNASARTFEIIGNWRILADENGFHNGNMQNVTGGNVTLPAYGTYILVQ
ncbi:MAG: hypothetical protein K5753_01535 [Clostridia bacterium]|nr:hypothetical protein [Clostridia bacterium]